VAAFLRVTLGKDPSRPTEENAAENEQKADTRNQPVIIFEVYLVLFSNEYYRFVMLLLHFVCAELTIGCATIANSVYAYQHF